MSLADDRFLLRVTRRVGEAGLRRAKSKIPSSTLRRSLTLEVKRVILGKRNVAKATLLVPQYWSLYVHDGRRPFRKLRSMIWFRNPKEDPRLNAGKTPARAANVRHLTRTQFVEAMARRRAWIASGGDPANSPVIVTKIIRKGTKPTPFFSNDPGGGMHGFGKDASRIIQAEFSEHVKDTMGNLYKLSDTAFGVL